MTGLEKILKAIEEDAEANAKTVLDQANRKADEILSAARAEAGKKCAQIAEKSDEDLKAVISRAESAVALQEKKIILEAKQQIISNVLDSARKSLKALSDSEYIDIILKMVKKYAHNKSGEILFSAFDIKRLPKNFDDKLKQALSEKSSAVLTVSGKPAAIDGGFLLIYGDIEENCSFDALFSAARENLQDQVNSLLFE
jgi:V/A-type H+-transporting ATPase subunit E